MDKNEIAKNRRIINTAGVIVFASILCAGSAAVMSTVFQTTPVSGISIVMLLLAFSIFVVTIIFTSKLTLDWRLSKKALFIGLLCVSTAAAVGLSVTIPEALLTTTVAALLLISSIAYGASHYISDLLELSDEIHRKSRPEN